MPYELLPALMPVEPIRTAMPLALRRALGARQQEVSAGLNFAQMCLNK